MPQTAQGRAGWKYKSRNSDVNIEFIININLIIILNQPFLQIYKTLSANDKVYSGLHGKRKVLLKPIFMSHTKWMFLLFQANCSAITSRVGTTYASCQHYLSSKNKNLKWHIHLVQQYKNTNITP
jgi:hypothetical protein